ncbi:DUF3124 domain-containing protein [Pontimicrobium sp. MEBiC01747]|jgi:hypothetical protein
MKLKYLFLFFLLSSCIEPKNPNVDSSGQDELESREVYKPVNEKELEFHDLIYVPIYSDIYIDSQNQNHLLSATLSIRNTSTTDSLFISKINYYNTDGNMVKRFINGTISLRPMATVNYVIEKEDNSGGSGANFIVELKSKNSSTKPVIQAVMMGQYSNKAFSFITDGYSLK